MTLSVIPVACSSGAPGRKADAKFTTTTTPGRSTPGAPSGGKVFGDIEHEYQGSGPPVVILGDSVMVRSRSRVRDELSGYSVKIAALTGEGLSGGQLSHALGSGAMPEVAKDLASESPRPDVLVIELGTNDAWTDALTLARARTSLKKITDAFPGVCTVTVTISETSDAEDYDQGEARQLNKALIAAGDHIVDWRTLSHAQPGLLMPDGIHPTPSGSQVLADALRQAVTACEKP